VSPDPSTDNPAAELPRVTRFPLRPGATIGLIIIGVMFLIPVAMTAGLAWQVRDRGSIAMFVVCTLTFGLIGMVWIRTGSRRFRERRPGLVLSRAGFWNNSVFPARGFVSWQRVRSLTVNEMPVPTRIVIALEPRPDTVARHGAGPVHVLGARLGDSADQEIIGLLPLAAEPAASWHILLRYLQAAGKGAMVPELAR